MFFNMREHVIQDAVSEISNVQIGLAINYKNARSKALSHRIISALRVITLSLSYK